MTSIFSLKYEPRSSAESDEEMVWEENYLWDSHLGSWKKEILETHARTLGNSYFKLMIM